MCKEPACSCLMSRGWECTADAARSLCSAMLWAIGSLSMPTKVCSSG